jgi:hypothetical protein
LVSIWLLAIWSGIGDSPGCLSLGTQLDRIVRAPFIKPEAARPATVLPIINIADVTAAPQIAEPISKTTKNVKKVHYTMSDPDDEVREIYRHLHTLEL